MSKNSNQEKGESLVSFVLMSQVFLLLFAALTLGALKILARSFLALDSYVVARAHLYKNDLGYCRPSQHWPALPRLRVDFTCPKAGSVESKLTYQDLLIDELEVNLL